MNQLIPIGMWLLAVTYAILQFFTQLTMGHMAHQVMGSFQIDALGLSYLSSAFFYTFLLMQIPAGMLLDRFGRRFILTIAIIIFALGCFLFSQSQTFPMAIASRLVMGVGSAFGFLGMLSVAAIWFKPEKFAFLVGLSEMIVMLVVAMAQLYLPNWLAQFGWQVVLWNCGIIGVSLGLLIFAFLRDPNSKPNVRTKSKTTSSLFEIIKNKQAWVVGASSGLMLSVMTVYCALWGVPFLVDVHHLSYEQAGYASAIAVLGLGFGASSISYFAGKLGVLKPILFAFLMLIIFTYSLIIWMPGLKLQTLYALNFILGFSAGSYVLFFEVSRKICSEGNLNSMMGFINMLTMSGSIFIQPVTGYVLDQFNRGILEKGLPVYSSYGFKVALSTLIACSALAIVLLFYIKEEKHPVYVQEPLVDSK